MRAAVGCKLRKTREGGSADEPRERRPQLFQDLLLGDCES